MPVARANQRPPVTNKVATEKPKATNGEEKALPRTPEVKAAKFKEIAQRRTRQVVKVITGMGNLSNKGNYEYSADQIDKIFKAIQEALTDTRAKFEAKVKQSAPGFEL